MIRMTATGVKETERRFQRAGPLIFNTSAENVASTTRRITYKAKSFAPVDTGTLKKDITYAITPGKTMGLVGIREGSPALKYWFYVEYGTHKAGAQPYFRTASEAEHDPFVRSMVAMGRRLENL
jgi:HK97 gp10 family phage protein